MAILSISTLCFCLSGYSVTAGTINQIGGHITSDATWTPTDTYRVIADTTIDSTVTLTISPRVRVQFADGVSLIVEGSLKATGTDSNPITFTSDSVSPAPGAWGTIQFKGSDTEFFSLSNVKVEFATQGVTVESAGSTEITKSELVNCSESGITVNGNAWFVNSNLIISENKIMQNKNGISTDDSSYYSGLTISGNTICSNTQNGIYLESYGFHGSEIHNITCSYNNVSSNGLNGIYLSAYVNGEEWEGPSKISNVTFLNNIVYSNSQDGIYLYTHSTSYGNTDSYISDCKFSNNNIFSNLQNGISLYSSTYHDNSNSEISNITISSNTLSSNGENGLSFNSLSSNNNIIFHNNFINNNIQLTKSTLGYSWDNGSEGNYWSSYNGNDANHDGIGDTPYVIYANNIDNYPLMAQYPIPEYQIPELSLFLILPLILSMTLLLLIILHRRKTSLQSET